MYCAHCGKELVEGANFCTACGSRSAVAERMAAAEELAPEGTGGVSAALASGRSRSRLRISPLVLLVLALALTAGIAAAAYYVYTEVYLPSVQSSDARYDSMRDNAGGESQPEFSFEYEYAPNDDEYHRFMYPVIASATPNEAVESLNERMKAEVLEAAQNTPPGTSYVTLRYLITYCKDGVISLWKVRSSGVGHVDMSGECETIDLVTGEQLKPESVMGMSRQDLYSKTLATVESIEETADGVYGLDAIAGDVEQSGSHFFLVDGGIAYSFRSHQFGTTHGIFSIVVDSDGSLYSTGDYIGGNAAENTAKLPGVKDGTLLIY